MLNLDEGQSGEVDYTDEGGLPNTKQVQEIMSTKLPVAGAKSGAGGS
jgi:hypothetical protein